MTREEKLEALNKEFSAYEKNIMSFRSDFIPSDNPKEPGCYITIRCGLSGIYQTLNEWKDGHWMAEAADGSRTIAYSREKIELKSLKLFEEE